MCVCVCFVLTLFKFRSSSEDIEAALMAAKLVHDSGLWRITKPSQKAKILREIADELREVETEMASLDAVSTGVCFLPTPRVYTVVFFIFFV